MIPIAKLLRQSSLSKSITTEVEISKNGTGDSTHNRNNPNKVSLLSLEEQIAQLEKQIETADSDSESSTETEIIETQSDDAGLLIEKDENGNLLRLVSTLQEEERIAPLPASLLPSSQCKFSNKTSSDDRKRKVTFVDEVVGPRKRPNSKAPSMCPPINGNGLMKTVQEMIKQYQPASLEKRPNYCRVCKFQGSSTEELELHRSTQAHKDMIELERRLCYCKLCRKQFTSPEQLKEHLNGKAHTERLDKIRSSQVARKKFSH